MTIKFRFIGVNITNLQQIVSIFELYRKLLWDKLLVFFFSECSEVLSTPNSNSELPELSACKYSDYSCILQAGASHSLSRRKTNKREAGKTCLITYRKVWFFGGDMTYSRLRRRAPRWWKTWWKTSCGKVWTIALIGVPSQREQSPHQGSADGEKKIVYNQP